MKRITTVLLALLTLTYACAAQSDPSQSSNGGTYVYGPTASPSFGSHVAPGEIATFTVLGLTIQGGQPTSASGLPLPYTLGGISGQISGLLDLPTAVPILSVASDVACPSIPVSASPCLAVSEVTVEIPTEIHNSTPGGNGAYADDNLVFSDRSGHDATINLFVLLDDIHVLLSCSPTGAGCNPVVTAADGSYPSVVHAGDVLVAYAYGLGTTAPIIPSGAGAPTASLSPAAFSPVVNFAFQLNAGPIRPVRIPGAAIAIPEYAQTGYALPLFAGAVPGYVGLYQVNVQVPPMPLGAPSCSVNAGTTNLTITLIGASSYDGFAVCVQ